MICVFCSCWDEKGIDPEKKLGGEGGKERKERKEGKEQKKKNDRQTDRGRRGKGPPAELRSGSPDPCRCLQLTRQNSNTSDCFNESFAIRCPGLENLVRD